MHDLAVVAVIVGAGGVGVGIGVMIGAALVKMIRRAARPGRDMDRPGPPE